MTEISGSHGGVVALTVEAVSTSEKLVNYQITRRNIPEHSHLQVSYRLMAVRGNRG